MTENTVTLSHDFVQWLLNEACPDLNNIVRAAEDESDRVYFGSSNDADELTAIARRIDRERPKLEAAIAAERARLAALVAGRVLG